MDEELADRLAEKAIATAEGEPAFPYFVEKVDELQAMAFARRGSTVDVLLGRRILEVTLPRQD
jgi:hypothetical protein